MKSARPSPEKNNPLPQVRLVPPRKPLSQTQHLVFGAAMLIMLIILLVLAIVVRQWQEHVTQETSMADTVETEPQVVEMDDQSALAVINPSALARKNHIIVGVDEPITRINPLYATGTGENDAAALIFESLVQLDESRQVNLELAESYTFDAAGHQIVFMLRNDHYFRDGRAVEARDVVMTYKMILANSYDGQLQGHLSAITGIKPDPANAGKVIFQLADWVSEPDMAWFTVGVLKSDAYPVDLAKVYTLGLNTPTPEGSGPFELSEQSAERTVLTLRPGFGGEITTIEFQRIDSAEKFNLLKSGVIDLAYTIWDARLKERLDSLEAYTWKKYEATAAFALINRTPGGSSVLQSIEQQDAVFAALAGMQATPGDPEILADLSASQLSCYFYKGIDANGLAENREMAERALQPLQQKGLQLEFVAADWPDLASRALEGRFDLMVIPTPANERLPATSALLDRPETGALIGSANTMVAATETHAILVSRRLRQVTLNPHSRPLATSSLSWTDRIENIRFLTQEG